MDIKPLQKRYSKIKYMLLNMKMISMPMRNPADASLRSEANQSKNT